MRTFSVSVNFLKICQKFAEGDGDGFRAVGGADFRKDDCGRMFIYAVLPDAELFGYVAVC